ncbi:MAG TPA: hypothetical protein VFJ16_27915 [Longimicrobium sp.]|nr:hypothetical protein [Longimicrobium sp.]
MTRSRPWFRRSVGRGTAAALACALLLGACTTWEEQWNPAPGASPPIGLVRVTRTDGSAMVLEHVTVRGDSIVGTPPRMTAPVAFALAGVKKVEVQRSDPVATFWTAAIGAAAGFFGFLYLAVANDSS